MKGPGEWWLLAEAGAHPVDPSLRRTGPAVPCLPGTVFRPRDPATPPGPPGGSRLEPLTGGVRCPRGQFPDPRGKRLSVFPSQKPGARLCCFHLCVAEGIFQTQPRWLRLHRAMRVPAHTAPILGPGSAPFGSLQAYFRGGGSGRGPSGSAGATPKSFLAPGWVWAWTSLPSSLLCPLL